MSFSHGLDKQALKDFGYNLWLLRQQQNLTVKQLSSRLNIPERIIDCMEIGRFVQYNALRRIMDYYGKKTRIVIE